MEENKNKNNFISLGLQSIGHDPADPAWRWRLYQVKECSSDRDNHGAPLLSQGSTARPEVFTRLAAVPELLCLPYWPHSLTLWVSLSLYVSFVGIVTTSHHHQPQPAHSIQDTISDGNLSPGEGEEERTNLVKLRHHNNYISDIHYFFFIFQPRTAALGK